jgi:hypothetical protein
MPVSSVPLSETHIAGRARLAINDPLFAIADAMCSAKLLSILASGARRVD